MTRKYIHKNKNFKIAAENYYLDVSSNKIEIAKISKCINWIRQLEKTRFFFNKTE